VFEAQPKGGGMLRYGIPEYRLPYSKLDDDIDIITSLGVDLRCGVRIGTDIALEALHHDHDAVLLAIGLHIGRSTRVPGADHDRVIPAVDLLRDVTFGVAVEAPPQAVVIGGGNVAMDAARTLARLQFQQRGKVDVTVTCLESRHEMLADEDEIVEAQEEGIRILPGRGPRRCVIDDGHLTGLETVECLSVFDEQGRFHPRYNDDDIQTFSADLIVEAIGQAPDLGLLGTELTESLEWERRRIKVDAAGRTSQTWLWAAGDLVEGPDAIHAIAAGHRVAESIHAALTEAARATG
jgi:glutamate synthase (NADPH/NADH) small chain